MQEVCFRSSSWLTHTNKHPHWLQRTDAQTHLHIFFHFHMLFSFSAPFVFMSAVSWWCRTEAQQRWACTLSLFLHTNTHKYTHTHSRAQETGQSLYCRGDSSQRHWERNIDFLTGYFCPLNAGIHSHTTTYIHTPAFKDIFYILCVCLWVCVIVVKGNITWYASTVMH